MTIQSDDGTKCQGWQCSALLKHGTNVGKTARWPDAGGLGCATYCFKHMCDLGQQQTDIASQKWYVYWISPDTDTCTYCPAQHPAVRSPVSLGLANMQVKKTCLKKHANLINFIGIRHINVGRCWKLELYPKLSKCVASFPRTWLTNTVKTKVDHNSRPH